MTSKSHSLTVPNKSVLTFLSHFFRVLDPPVVQRDQFHALELLVCATYYTHLNSCVSIYNIYSFLPIHTVLHKRTNGF